MRLVTKVRPLKALLTKTLFGAALVAGAAGCSGKTEVKTAPPPREVKVVALAPHEVRDTGEYLGSLLSRQSVTVLPQVAGYVRKILVKPGQKVEAGTPLVEVDARQETAALDSAQAQQSSSTVDLELARRTLARTESLNKEGLASVQELERAQAAVKAAEAATRAAGATVAQRQVQLQFHVVRAPFAGTMGDVLVRVGDFVGATTTLTTVAQADALEVSVSVPSFRARSLKPDTVLELLDQQGKLILSSTVFYVAPQTDPRTQLVEVKAAFRNTVGLRPSELLRARLVYATRDALQIPALAVVRQSGQPFAMVVETKEGKTLVERRPVTLGTLGDMSYVVEGGLKQGDLVAVSSLHMLKDGMPVIPKQVTLPDEPAQAPGTTARADEVPTRAMAPRPAGGTTGGSR
ncbi:efflux RND transporter periplasmic adaptor subunit [Corallococcus sp. bb12-1]|uniref:efflux RND transporter periplasmic adaptor subunit n=1 Tax=Corallococcus sp. bb12-1 TaxID=2996784 RepID=UPI00226E8C63|nr:efflux RND transporter periplasmic adaptor subunit [Corallococcus sp. bb12-1]MCY1041248.1 efflux RND transporter periplasmic adaptor subunit [Corallococcus sp. bb12-1]